MMRPALTAIVLALAAAAPAVAQSSPFGIPQPLGGPIIGPDGKVMSGLDKAPPPWTGGIEFGLSGSSGNVDIFKLLVGGDVRYDDAENVLRLNGLYILSRYSDATIEQKGFLYVRDEIPVLDGLSYYAQGQMEYDAFRTIDWRLAAHNGASITVLNTGVQTLKVRGGIGTARVWGSPGQEWMAEGQIGGDFEYRLTARTMFSAAADYYPDLHYSGNYRVRVRVSLDFELDPELGLFLRIGAMDRYDSMPFGSKQNDIDYFGTLMFRF